MKRSIILGTLLLFAFGSIAQDAKDILRKSYAKCQSIENGYYEMTKYMKYMSGPDTSYSSFFCHFKKLKEDSLFPSAFHYKRFFKDKYSGDAMYTGEELVTYSTNDSSGEIISKTLWAEDIESFSHNYTFYHPLIDIESAPMLHDSDISNRKHVIKYIGEENISGVLCYHITEYQIPDDDTDEVMKALKIEHHYWIKVDDFLPIQYTRAMDLFMNNDTMFQFEKFVLSKYEINNLHDSNPISMSSIPAFIKLKDYVPYKRPELLPNDTLAPDWTIPSLTDEPISLKNLKGQLVLVDFFYKGCYPCMLALPTLQALHEKYKDRGLRIIGIDPYDKKEHGIAAFLAKRGVTYTVLLGGKEVAKDYHVSGYPTIYLIDRQGKIIYSQVGYGKGTEAELEKIIEKSL
jgi:peroxiredoxin